MPDSSELWILRRHSQEVLRDRPPPRTEEEGSEAGSNPVCGGDEPRSSPVRTPCLLLALATSQKRKGNIWIKNNNSLSETL